MTTGEYSTVGLSAGRCCRPSAGTAAAYVHEVAERPHARDELLLQLDKDMEVLAQRPHALLVGGRVGLWPSAVLVHLALLLVARRALLRDPRDLLVSTPLSAVESPQVLLRATSSKPYPIHYHNLRTSKQAKPQI